MVQRSEHAGWHLAPGELVRGDGQVACAHRKVAIVGAGGGGRDAAPYGDPEWCVWALNEIPQPSHTRHFELHPMVKQNMTELEILAEMPAPCYVLDLAEARSPVQTTVDGETVTDYPGVRNPVAYPLDEVLAALRPGRRYFTCTFAFQVALAVYEGFSAIGLFGVGLYRGTARERTAERACVEYWVGYAEGRGIEVVADSGLARAPYLYGYDYDKEVKFVNNDVAQLRRAIDAERVQQVARAGSDDCPGCLRVREAIIRSDRGEHTCPIGSY